MKKLDILFIEDNPFDLEIIIEGISDYFELNLSVANSKNDLLKIINSDAVFDIVISDYNMPGFTANEALEMVMDKYPMTPFICVSGSIGEEKAVELLKRGATDYILKENLVRLVPAIGRALKEFDELKMLQSTQNQLKIQNEELIVAKQKAEESDRLKTAFLANMSHEIRTPLNGILGFSELLINEDFQEDRIEYQKVIEQSCNQLANLVNNILDLSLIEANRLKLDYGMVDLNEVFSYIYSIHTVDCAKKGLELKPVFLDKSESRIYTDEVKVKQILSNIVKNAIKFTPSGFIEFGATVHDSEFRFFIKDTGIGISECDQEIIFNRFRQLEDGHTKNFGGTGLGLSISKSLVELLQGRIWLESEQGVGTTFYFILPTSVEKQESIAI